MQDFISKPSQQLNKPPPSNYQPLQLHLMSASHPRTPTRQMPTFTSWSTPTNPSSTHGLPMMAISGSPAASTSLRPIVPSLQPTSPLANLPLTASTLQSYQQGSGQKIDQTNVDKVYYIPEHDSTDLKILTKQQPQPNDEPESPCLSEFINFSPTEDDKPKSKQPKDEPATPQPPQQDNYSVIQPQASSILTSDSQQPIQAPIKSEPPPSSPLQSRDHPIMTTESPNPTLRQTRRQTIVSRNYDTSRVEKTTPKSQIDKRSYKIGSARTQVEETTPEATTPPPQYDPFHETRLLTEHLFTPEQKEDMVEMFGTVIRVWTARNYHPPGRGSSLLSKMSMPIATF
jgi:hypothetical protein